MLIRLTSKWSKLSGYGLFGLVCASFGACGQARPNAPEASEAPVSSIESALENPLLKCEQDQASCLGSAQTAQDASAAVACNSGFRECLGGAAEMGQQLTLSLQQCRDEAEQCAVQGGATGAEACRTDYDSCVSALMADEPAAPAAGAGGSGLPQLPAAGRGFPRLPTAGGVSFPMRRLPFAGAGGFGGLPRLPAAGSIGLPAGAGRGGLPGRGPGLPQNACFEALRTCAAAPNADLNQCATTARACLRGERGPGGEAGAGGAP